MLPPAPSYPILRDVHKALEEEKNQRLMDEMRELEEKEKERIKIKQVKAIEKAEREREIQHPPSKFIKMDGDNLPPFKILPIKAKPRFEVTIKDPDTMEEDYSLLPEAGATLELQNVHPLIPKPHFFMCIIAPTEMGKTTFIGNMIGREGAYRNIFDQINVVSPSFKIDPIWERFDFRNGRSFEKWDVLSNAYFHSMIDKQKEDFDQGRKLKLILNIFDDITDMNIDLLERMVTRYRWSNMSFIVSSHGIRKLKTIVRNCCTDWIIFDVVNGKEWEAIADEMRGPMSRREFRKLFNEVMMEPRSFMHVARKFPLALRYRKRFEKILPCLENWIEKLE